MISLLSAGFSRLFRNLAFRIATLIMAFMPVMSTLLSYADKNTPREPLDGVYNSGLSVIWIIIGAFVPLFIGQDYDEKTMNNRIMAGHSRASIYLADYIVTLTGAVFMQAVAVIAGSAVAIPLFGMYRETVLSFAVDQFFVVCIMAAYTAIAQLITTVISSKNYALDVSMVVALALFIAGNAVFDNVCKLRTKAQQENIAVTELVGENSAKDIMFWSLPASQSDMLLGGGVPEKSGRMICTDLAAVVFFTAAGMFVFRRKDIK